MKIWLDHPVEFDNTTLDTYKHASYETVEYSNESRRSTINGSLQDWYSALPIGNGSLGGMVYGGIPLERIQVNEDTIWAGPPSPKNTVGAYKIIDEARELMFMGEYKKAEELMTTIMDKRISPRSYQPLGDILIESKDHLDYSNYRKELDLETGVVTVTYTNNGVNYRREVFTSFAVPVMVVRLEADVKESININVKLDRAVAPEATTLSDGLLMTGQADHEGKHFGVKFAGLLKAQVEGGEYQFIDGKLKVQKADSVTLYLVAATDYNKKAPHQPLIHNLQKKCEYKLKDTVGNDYDTVKNGHVAKYKEQFDRVEFSLGAEDVDLPVDKRLEAIKQGGEDLHLVQIYYQYGRYLIMSCSQPDSMSANLQGIWNSMMAAPWNSDYHININIQMIYWHVQACGLPECHLPFFDLIEALVKPGKETAKQVYNCRGFVAHHTTDAWLMTAPFGAVQYGMWPMAAGWCSRQFFEYYLYTGDKVFLKERGLPIFEEASLFFLDWLVKDPHSGYYVSGPSTSPENRFIYKGDKINLSMGCAMDQEIIWETFHNYLKTCDILGIDNEIYQEIKGVVEKLLMPKIGEDGRLMEWAEPFEEAYPGHRHISHLYGLYPSDMFADDDAYITASRNSLEDRLAKGGGHTGWSRAWIINLYARLKDGNEAYKNIVELLRKSTLTNLFDDHPPFQIDGNFGATAAINEMLLQSHGQHMELLPALPEKWSDGYIKGIRGRGGYKLDIAWKDGQLIECTLYAELGGQCTIKYGDKLIKVILGKGESKTFVSGDFK